MNINVEKLLVADQEKFKAILENTFMHHYLMEGVKDYIISHVMSFQLANSQTNLNKCNKTDNEKSDFLIKLKFTHIKQKPAIGPKFPMHYIFQNNEESPFKKAGCMILKMPQLKKLIRQHQKDLISQHPRTEGKKMNKLNSSNSSN